MPLYIMLITSFKTMDEIQMGNIFAWPTDPTIAPWVAAWSSACTGVACEGIRGGFMNSIAIVIPSTVLPILLGALNGYALSFWRSRGASILFGILLIGAFIPAQVMLFPLVRILAGVGLYSSLPGIVVVHIIFSMPVMTLLFRNYYLSVPQELFNAARIDGGGFLRIFFQLMLPIVDADDHRRRDHADHRRLERLPVRSGVRRP